MLTTVGSALALAVWMPLAMYPRDRSYIFIADGRPWNAVERSRRGVHHFWWSELNEQDMFPPPPPKQVLKNSLRALAGIPPETNAGDRPTTPQGWIDLAVGRSMESRRNAGPARRPAMILGPPRWGTFADGRAPDRTVSVGSDHGYGWPRPALWYRVHGVYLRNTASATAIEGGRLLTGEGTLEVRAYAFRALPHFVDVRGLLADSAIFAGAWALLLFAPGAARRALRRRRGLCLGCGYDLRAAAAGRCPECGRETAVRGGGGQRNSAT